MTGPYFKRVPAGPSDPPTLMKVVLLTWTAVIVLGLPVGIYYFIVRPWRRERRITLDGMLLVACGLLFFQDPLLNYFNTWSTYNSWMFNRGSWVQDIPGWVSYGEPGRMMAEPLLMNAPGYSYGVLLCTILGCWVMRRAKSRWPNISNAGLIGVLIVWTFFFDLVMEGLFLMPMGLYIYPGAIKSLSDQCRHLLPVAGLRRADVGRRAGGAVLLCATSPTIAAGHSSNADWNASRAGSRSSNSPASWRSSPRAACSSSCSTTFRRSGSPCIADPWPADIEKRSYFTHGHLRRRDRPTLPRSRTPGSGKTLRLHQSRWQACASGRRQASDDRSLRRGK